VVHAWAWESESKINQFSTYIGNYFTNQIEIFWQTAGISVNTSAIPHLLIFATLDRSRGVHAWAWGKNKKLVNFQPILEIFSQIKLIYSGKQQEYLSTPAPFHIY
jgi:hypothetical protein